MFNVSVRYFLSHILYFLSLFWYFLSLILVWNSGPNLATVALTAKWDTMWETMLNCNLVSARYFAILHNTACYCTILDDTVGRQDPTVRLHKMDSWANCRPNLPRTHIIHKGTRQIGPPDCRGCQTQLSGAQFALIQYIYCNQIQLNHHTTTDIIFVNFLHQHSFRILKIYPKKARKSRHFKP